MSYSDYSVYLNSHFHGPAQSERVSRLFIAMFHKIHVRSGKTNSVAGKGLAVGHDPL